MEIVAPGSRFSPRAIHCARVPPRGYHPPLPRRFPPLGSACFIRGPRLRYGPGNVIISCVGDGGAGISSDGSGRGSMVWLDRWSEQDRESGTERGRVWVDRRDELDGDRNGSVGSLRDGGGSGGSTMERIVARLKTFGHVENGEGDDSKGEGGVVWRASGDDPFYTEEGISHRERGGFEEGPVVGGGLLRSDREVMFPWEKSKEAEREDRWSARRESRTSMAELTLPESELRRLRSLTFRTKNKTRVTRGITQAVVDMIHERWKTSEIIRLKIEGASALNMRRTQEILERKTSGLVIWRSGNSLSLYRGVSYEIPTAQRNKRMVQKTSQLSNLSAVDTDDVALVSSQVVVPQEAATLSTNEESNGIDREISPLPQYEQEMDKLLNGLGPRYKDWPGSDPLPVDADLLPAVVPGYQPPFRILPYGVRATLSQKEATGLRRLARILPPHFALGRARQLQGLAAALVKLWEKSKIAKIALKRGVQHTTSERMAEDIKKLTGGVLISRNKDFLVFYRGNSFLSRDVTEALVERESLAKSLQDEEEQARLRASAFVMPGVDLSMQPASAGTLGEYLNANSRYGKNLDERHREKVMVEAEISRHAKLVRKLENKLAYAERRLSRAEVALSKVEAFLKPATAQADPESISEEERFMFRKLGLRMKAFLLLGRRGVFDGTVENMHLHWKYRELVKIILKAKNFDHVRKIALALEAESGGVLVSVDKVSKGYAIIVFRGKDYLRPSTLRPKNLLTKRKALARSIELQRQEALQRHVSMLQGKVGGLRAEIEKMERMKDKGDETFYDRMDSEYPSGEDDSEDEDDNMPLENYESENDGKDDPNRSGYDALFARSLDFTSDDENDDEEDDLDEPAKKYYNHEINDDDAPDPSSHAFLMNSDYASDDRKDTNEVDAAHFVSPP
ncbi:hypothetical protein MLD38_030590 [Melastoma candidum]|uniref:Uncharacterized protein n=1 Tax=Melastoma candidum TaxID=119954 RepID=A0ACB9MQQ6_9MYRT|nr:hypothetical protein MLD38_030590 [Melastoma candidum]